MVPTSLCYAVVALMARNEPEQFVTHYVTNFRYLFIINR